MTKRTGNFNENASKKFKIEDNIDALWGEDLDENDVDDCFLLASQICERNPTKALHQNNVSILPNYSFFKESNENVFTSTQCNNNAISSNNNRISSNNKSANSKFNLPSNDVGNVANNEQELQKKVEKLQADYITKEGEVTILRSQLKQIRVNLETEHQKKEKEWTEKIQLTSKELVSIKSELDFKNLEVANLKNKIQEVTKIHGDVSLNGIKRKEEKRNVDIPLKLIGACEKHYPLRDKIDPSIFVSSKKEYFYIDNKRTLNTFNNENDQKTMKQYEADKEYNNFKLDSIFPYISMMINCSEAELNSNVTKEPTCKILEAALDVTKKLYKNLEILKCYIEEDIIRQRDLIYLNKKLTKFSTNSSIFGNEDWFVNEIGIKSRRIIAVLAEILPYSNHLRQLMLQKSINLNRTLDNFFNLVQSVIKTIGILRMSERCVGFLCSVLLFMIKTTATPEFEEWYGCIGDIIKETIFARPPRKTLEYLSEFFKESSSHVNFVRNMCKLTQHQSYPVNNSEDVLYYNEESCFLRVFTVLYKENFINTQIGYKTSTAILQFIKQLLKSNVLWTHFSNESNYCNCMRKIMKIGIRIVHETTKHYTTERIKCLPNRELMREIEIILKFSLDLLHIIKFKRNDIFNKHSVCSQYKFIVQTLSDHSRELKLNDQECETLKELNIRDELPGVNTSALDNISVWY